MMVRNGAVVARPKELGGTRGGSRLERSRPRDRTNAFAFLLAVAFDQGMPWQNAWRTPVEIDQAGA